MPTDAPARPLARHDDGHDPRPMLSALWVAATLSYLYCDVISLMDSHTLGGYLAGDVDGIVVTRGFLLAASALMLVPISMTLLARVLPHRANRWANVAAGVLMTGVQLASLFVGSLTAHYALFSGVEIVLTALVVRRAWLWRRPVRTGAAALAGA